MSKSLSPFHVAVPVHDLEMCRRFYADVLGCPQGRSADHWVDFDLFGHQFVIHLKQGMEPELHYNEVDGKGVPVPHFGVVLPWDDFQQLARKVTDANVKFIIAPYIRFEGEVGEQATMFFTDPSGNALEFKAFRDPSQLFAK